MVGTVLLLPSDTITSVFSRGSALSVYLPSVRVRGAWTPSNVLSFVDTTSLSETFFVSPSLKFYREHAKLDSIVFVLRGTLDHFSCSTRGSHV